MQSWLPLIRSAWRFATAFALLLASGCQVSATGDESEQYGQYFTTDQLVQVELELDPSDWEQIRHERRNVIGLFGDECAQHPAEPAYSYVLAAATIDGRQFPQVGLRKKGFIGSNSSSKPSLKIKFNETVSGQNLSGLGRMTLNNNHQDESHMDQCLGYALFRAAGVPAPRCGFAFVTVNDTPLGIYTHVQSIKKPFLRAEFGDDSGNLYEGNLSDFRAGWTATFERKTNKADSPGTEDRSDLAAVTAALAASDDELLSALGAVIDLDEFYSFWALETMLAHGDGYSGNNNNYYLYANPRDGLFHFIPWGTDQLFESDSAPPAQTHSAIARRLFLHDEGRAAYLARYQELLDQIWDDQQLLDDITAMDALLRPNLQAGEEGDYNSALAELRAAVTGREQRLLAQLESATASDAQELSGPLCFDKVGAITATFTTTWGGSASANATMTYQFGGTPAAVTSPAATVGADAASGRTALHVTAKMPDGSTLRAASVIPDATAAPRAVDLSANGNYSEMTMYWSSPDQPHIHYFTGGTLTLTAAAAQAGASWSGSLSMDIWRAPWQR